jgi:hypothetical protein
MAQSVMPIQATAYAANVFDDILEALALQGGAATQGVVRAMLNELAVTGATSPVSIATGWAIVKGKLYKNSAVEPLAIPTPAVSTRIDRVVLRLNYTTETCVIARVAGAEGGGAPALTQTDGTLWEISLAQASITTGGAITLTDERAFLLDGMVRESSLGAAAVGPGKIKAGGVSATAQIADGIVTLPKLAEHSVDSPQYVHASIDLEHLAAEVLAAIASGRIVGELMANYAATVGGSDGRRMVVGGSAYESWVHCDGGATVNGVTIPDFRDRVVAGASASHAKGTIGGADAANLAHVHDKGTIAAGSHRHNQNTTTSLPDVYVIVSAGTGHNVSSNSHTHLEQNPTEYATPGMSGSTASGGPTAQDMRQATRYCHMFIYVG